MYTRKLRQGNKKIQIKNKVHKRNYVFIFSLILTGLIVSVGILLPEKFNYISTKLFNVLIDKFSPMYLLLMLGIFIFSLYLAFSKYGAIKLGRENDKPEFSNVVWFSMLFGAGMGIGLVFFGAWEPMSHFVNPLNVKAGSEDAIKFAMEQSFIHWGFMSWVSYAVIGVSLAYFQFRKGRKGLISTTLDPILEDNKYKDVIKLVIDVLAVFITIVGVAASMGLGTMQIGGGIQYLFGIKNTFKLQIFIILVITMIYIWTAVGGLDKGMKQLSNINLALATLLIGGCFFIGPTSEIMNTFVNGMGDCINYFISQSLFINPITSNEWVYKWRIFYWAYWISWSPFVGVFIARISKGRTIREFILGVIIIPSIICMFWFAVFGMMGMNLGFDFAKDAIICADTSLFKVLENYRGGFLFSNIAIFLLFTFFITSANSAIYVLGMFTSRGSLNPNNKIKVVWGVIQALFAIVFIMLGGLDILQRFAIVVSFPFVFVLIGIMVSIAKELKKEMSKM
ncbi:BCCT family transporter [Terrisporobacter sp.]